MPLYRRVYMEGAIYFFTLVTKNRIKLFRDKFTATLFLKTVHTIKMQHPFKMIAWVLMPDHFHCIWQMPEGDSDYSNRWRMIKSNFTHTLNKSLSVKKKYWQNRFWEHTIRNDFDLENHINYIHYNPIKHGYVKHVVDWPFSSFHGYVKKGIYPKDWGKIDSCGIEKNNEGIDWGE